MPGCTFSHLSISYLHNGLLDALQRVVDAVLLVALALPQRLHSLAHFYFDIIKDSKIITEPQQLPEMPQELLLPPPNVVDHRKAYPSIINLLHADYHPEQMGEDSPQLHQVSPLIIGLYFDLGCQAIKIYLY